MAEGVGGWRLHPPDDAITGPLLLDQSEKGVGPHRILHSLNNIIARMIKSVMLENKYPPRFGIDVNSAYVVVI